MYSLRQNGASLHFTHGWEAIEQYLLEVKREAEENCDQQVPQMSVDTMLQEVEKVPRRDELYSEELSYVGPSPVYVTAPKEEDILRGEEFTEYYDLDQDSSCSHDQSFYNNDEVFTRCKSEPETIAQMNASNTDNIEIMKTTVKTEAFDDFSQEMCCRRFNEEQKQFYHIMENQILNECIEDVMHTCKCLRISPDPEYWTCDQVLQWISWQCREYNLARPNMDYFSMTGSELSQLTEEQFKICAPDAGSTLSCRLVVWKSMVEQTTRQMYGDYFPLQMSQIPVPTSPSLPSSPESARFSPDSTRRECVQASTPKDVEYLPEEPAHHSHRQTIQLWQFLKLLLVDPSGNFTDCIRWIDRSRGIFKIENSTRVARLWGKRKNRPAMNYDKLSRSIRQYYKKGIIKKTEQSKRLVYQFCHT